MMFRVRVYVCTCVRVYVCTCVRAYVCTYDARQVCSAARVLGVFICPLPAWPRVRAPGFLFAWRARRAFLFGSCAPRTFWVRHGAAWAWRPAAGGAYMGPFGLGRAAAVLARARLLTQASLLIEL
jgi:hypothetical protein